LQAIDTFVPQAGTGHQFTKLDELIAYLVVRVDSDKVIPLMDETVFRSSLAERGL
jgi:hypothetical protein